jgi:hypothetical protein
MKLGNEYLRVFRFYHQNAMNQKDLTEYVVPQFLAIFPQLKEYHIDIHKDVTYLELESKQRKLNILISTRDNMITIGFSAGEGLFDWHDHLLGDESLDEKIKIAVEWINSIRNNKKGIIYSSVLGHFPGDPEDLVDIKRYQQKDEIIDFKFWSDY